MDRIKATAAPTTIKLGKREFKVSPLTDEGIATLDQWVRARHVRIARSTLPEDVALEQRELTERIALEQASNMSFMFGTGSMIMSSVEGWAQILWCCTREHHKDVTAKEFAGLLTDPGNLEDLRVEFERLNRVSDSTSKKKNVKKKKAKKKVAKKSRVRNR